MDRLTDLESIGILLSFVIVALLLVAWLTRRRRTRQPGVPRRSAWLTDRMVDEIIRTGSLSARYVPEEDLDLDEIAREEERFWSESWDEPGPYWE